MLEIPEPCEYLLRKAAERERGQPKRKSCVVVNKTERSWASDIKMQSLKVVLLGFGLALVQYFLTMAFWNGNAYPVVLEVCDLLSDFYFIWDNS